MGHELVSYEAWTEAHRDTEYPRYPERRLRFDFSRGADAMLDLQRQLEYEGVHVEAFFAELDSKIARCCATYPH